MIEQTEGGTVITGVHTQLFVMLAQRGALQLEMHGIKMSRGRSAFAVVKETYGFKGNREKVLEQLDAAIEKFRREHPPNES